MIRHWIRSWEKYALQKKLNNHYNLSLRKFNISHNGYNFQETGMTMKDATELDEYVVDYITPILDNIEKDAEILISKYKDICDAELECLENKISNCNTRLSTANADDYLVIMEGKLAYRNELEKELEEMASQEQDLKKMIDESIEKTKVNLANVLERNEEFDILSDLQKHSQIFDVLKLTNSRIKGMIKNTSSFRHSLVNPPKMRFVLLFYAVCIFLCIVEIGFSQKIVNHIIDMGISKGLAELGWDVSNDTLNIIFSLLYCLGISVSFAFIWKFIIDRFIHRSIIRSFVMTLVILGAIIFMAYLFSSIDENSGGKGATDRFNLTGIMLGFFSVSFAVANALIFREALYIHLQILSLNKNGKKRSLERKIRRYKEKWDDKLSKLQQDKIRMQHDLNSFGDGYLTGLKKQVENLKRICVTQLKRGYAKHKSPVTPLHKSA